jgi:hypothetical protein
MGFWKRHTNSCAKWENVAKDAHEAIENHHKKVEKYLRTRYPSWYLQPGEKPQELDEEDEMQMAEAQWQHHEHSNHIDNHNEEYSYYEYMQRHLNMIGSNLDGLVSHFSKKSFKENYTNHETGCFENKYSGPNYDHWQEKSSGSSY